MTTPQSTYVHLDQRTPDRTNRIRYPRPNRLGLAKARGELTPYTETRVIDPA